MFVLATSFICWIPYSASLVIQYIDPTIITTFSAYNVFAVHLYTLHPVINPIIYWWRLDDFREAFCEIFCRCFYKAPSRETEAENDTEMTTAALERAP